MKTSIVPIGNSKGIRIPKSILEQCDIQREVELKVEESRIIIVPVEKHPRQGWEDAFRRMSANQDDELVIPDDVDLDAGDWEW